MKLILHSLDGRRLDIDVDRLAGMFGMAPLERAMVAYETTEEFLDSLEDREADDEA